MLSRCSGRGEIFVMVFENGGFPGCGEYLLGEYFGLLFDTFDLGVHKFCY